MPTTYEVAENCQRIMLTKAAEVTTYLGWSSDFATSELRNLPAHLHTASWFEPIDPAKLTRDEMLQLGFRKFSEETSIYLIPLWLLPYLAEELDGVYSIDGTSIQKKSEMDTDNCFGVLAYGVNPAEEKETNGQV